MESNEFKYKPGILKFYKGKGAAAFSLIPPHYDQNGYCIKHGAVLLEAAPGVGEQQWDWEQKISFAISVADIAAMVDNDPKRRRIFHKHQDNPKTLEFKPGEGNFAGTYMMTLSEGKGASHRSVSVPFFGGEYTVLMRLFLSTCHQLIGWTDDAIQNLNKRR